jgi:glutamate 5-kinase
MKRIVVKIGTNVWLDPKTGELRRAIFQNLVAQISEIKKQKIDVAVVVSGAVAFGEKIFREKDFKKNEKIFSENKTLQRQIFSSIGQIELSKKFADEFEKYKFFAAQFLATRSDFFSREKFLHARDCISALLKNHIVPVCNENDTVALDNLSFFDNDEFSQMIASMIDADKLIILTSVDGFFAGEKILHEIFPTKQNLSRFVKNEKTAGGKGGMETKLKIARKLAKIGIETQIANGREKNILLKILNSEKVGTKFFADEKISQIKKWIAVSRGIEKGKIFVNSGARLAIENGGSLLPVGILRISGNFEKNDVVEIRDENEEIFAFAVARENSQIAKNLIGKKNQKPLARRDFIFLE